MDADVIIQWSEYRSLVIWWYYVQNNLTQIKWHLWLEDHFTPLRLVSRVKFYATRRQQTMNAQFISTQSCIYVSNLVVFKLFKSHSVNLVTITHPSRKHVSQCYLSLLMRFLKWQQCMELEPIRLQTGKLKETATVTVVWCSKQELVLTAMKPLE